LYVRSIYSDSTTTTLTRLKAHLYWYNLTTIGAVGVEGSSKQGNFTIKMYITSKYNNNT
jgi:hypothetical protein